VSINDNRGDRDKFLKKFIEKYKVKKDIEPKIVWAISTN
jgi:hypothetical protein